MKYWNEMKIRFIPFSRIETLLFIFHDIHSILKWQNASAKYNFFIKSLKMTALYNMYNQRIIPFSYCLVSFSVQQLYRKFSFYVSSFKSLVLFDCKLPRSVQHAMSYWQENAFFSQDSFSVTFLASFYLSLINWKRADFQIETRIYKHSIWVW